MSYYATHRRNILDSVGISQNNIEPGDILEFRYKGKSKNSLEIVLCLNALNKDIGVVFDTSKPDGQIRKTVSCDKMLSLIGDFEFTKLKDGVIKVYNEVIKKYEK